MSAPGGDGGSRPQPQARSLPRQPAVAPSILSVDFGHLADGVASVLEAGARVIHVDVMDGHFVPPITLGPLIVEGIRDRVHDAGGYVDVHLMVERPERHVAAFAEAGADGITIHQEATPHLHYALAHVRDAGCRAGLALCPGTPASAVDELVEMLDVVLCMTVNPGWGGQRFIASSPDKVRRLRERLPTETVLEVDGGIDAQTAPVVVEAGAGLLVAGSAVFGVPDPARAYASIAAAATEAAAR